MRLFNHRLLIISAAVFYICTANVTVAEDAGVKFFTSKVRPIFVKHCYKCHGPKEQESGLRLDQYQAMLDGGETGPAVVPGSLEESLLINAVEFENDELQMPPDEPLSDEDVANLRKWIKLGAPHPNAKE